MKGEEFLCLDAEERKAKIRQWKSEITDAVMNNVGLNCLTFYHGTDELVANLSSTTVKKYRKALLRYIIEVRNYVVDHGLNAAEIYYDPVMSGFMRKSKDFEYEAMYVTTSYRRARIYAENSHSFGELGNTVMKLRQYVKENNFPIDVDSDTLHTIDEIWALIMDSDPRPVVYRLKEDFDYTKVVAMESGAAIDIPDAISWNWYEQSSFDDGEQESYRLDHSCGFGDFERAEADLSAEYEKAVEKRKAVFGRYCEEYIAGELIDDYDSLSDIQKDEIRKTVIEPLKEYVDNYCPD